MQVFDTSNPLKLGLSPNSKLIYLSFPPFSWNPNRTKKCVSFYIFQLWYLNIGSQKDDQSATSALLDLVIENHVASTHLANRATSRSEIVYLIQILVSTLCVFFYCYYYSGGDPKQQNHVQNPYSIYSYLILNETYFSTMFGF